jgi:hypothetical protein
VELTESFQFVPEQTTAAMVVHHPEAKYYSTISRPFLNVTGDVG